MNISLEVAHMAGTLKGINTVLCHLGDIGLDGETVSTLVQAICYMERLCEYLRSEYVEPDSQL